MFSGIVSSIVGWHFLFDDIRLYGHTQVIGLTGEVCRSMIIYTVYFKPIVSGVAPKYSCHTKFVRHFKGSSYFLQLARAVITSPVDGGTN